MKTHLSFKINGKTIRYEYDGAMKASEQQAVNKFIGMAYNMSAYAIKQLAARTSESASFFKSIYCESIEEGADKIAAVYKSIMQHIERNLKVRRENVFLGEDGKEVSTVLSGADSENGVVIIYDAFFKKAEGDDKGLNARSSVIMHEIAHLVGLEGDEEEGNPDSAECLRNFTLLVCEIVKPEDLFIGDEEANEENAELVGENGELPNNPNHHPAGAPDGKGGQFAPKEGGASGGGTDSKDEETPKENSDGGAKSSSSKENGDSENQDITPKEDKIPNAKSILNLQDDGIKVSESGNWCAGNISISGLKEKEPYTVIVDIEYEVTNPETGKSHKETAKIAIDAVADKNGNIDIKRVGILGEYNQNPDDNKFQKNDELKVTATVSVAEGSVKDNFDGVDNLDPEETKNRAPEKRDADREKHGMGFYPGQHASQAKWLDTPKPKEYNGGAVTDKKFKKDPSELKKIGTSVIKYHPGITKTTVEGDTLNTAKGKGGYY